VGRFSVEEEGFDFSLVIIDNKINDNKNDNIRFEGYVKGDLNEKYTSDLCRI
jgi:hypothetical protein